MKFFCIVFIILLCSNLLVGCSKTVKYLPPGKVKYIKQGPPPHAPAHGYRYKHEHGVVLEYDNKLGVYIVLEKPALYFYNGLYIKFSGGHWMVASHFKEPWRKAIKGEIPDKFKKAKSK